MSGRNQNFETKAKMSHGERYDYSKVKFKGNRDKVTITCKIHGDFQQTPYNHIVMKQSC